MTRFCLSLFIYNNVVCKDNVRNIGSSPMLVLFKKKKKKKKKKKASRKHAYIILTPLNPTFI